SQASTLISCSCYARKYSLNNQRHSMVRQERTEPKGLSLNFPLFASILHDSPFAQLCASLRVLHFVPPLRVMRMSAQSFRSSSLRGGNTFSKAQNQKKERTTMQNQKQTTQTADIPKWSALLV